VGGGDIGRDESDGRIDEHGGGRGREGRVEHVVVFVVVRVAGIEKRCCLLLGERGKRKRGN
jgi:hypothetical protein